MREERGFSVGAALKFGWGVSRANLGSFAPMLLVILVVAGLSQALESATRDRFPASLLASIVTMIVSLAVSLGVVRVSLALLDRGKASLRDLVPPAAMLPPYLVATFLYVLAIIGGLILGIVPGIIWGIRFSLYPFLIVDSGLGATDALRASSRLTRGARWDLLALSILEGIVNILGALCLLVGLFLTVPTGWMAKARAYRALLAQSEMPPETVAEPGPAVEPAAPMAPPDAAAQDEDPPTAS